MSKVLQCLHFREEKLKQSGHYKIKWVFDMEMTSHKPL